MISQLDIFPKYQHNKFGKFMFDLCAKGTKFLNKNVALYYILSFTWGLIMSLIGVIITLILLSLGNFIISIINLIFTYINNYNSSMETEK